MGAHHGAVEHLHQMDCRAVFGQHLEEGLKYAGSAQPQWG
jgi:hypothetical protein